MTVTPTVDDHRRALGLLTVDEALALGADGVRVLDPWSTLVSSGVVLGRGTVLYPGVVVQRDGDGVVEVGEDTVLYPGTFLLAAAGGSIRVGARCEVGPGGVQVKANQPGASIELGTGVRLLNGCELVGRCRLGDGAQVIGTIAAQSVELGGGLGGHGHPEPDERGAVLKGAGLARGLRLQRGDVVNLTPSFDGVPVERQSTYHPKPSGSSQ